MSGKMSSSSAAGPSHCDAALDDSLFDNLSGPELVARLRVATRKADYDAAARVLDARDRRLAKAEAALAELKPGLASANADLQTLREEYQALRAARSGPIRGGSSRGAIADPRPQGDGRAEGADKKNAEVIDLCDSSDDEDALEEGEFRPDGAMVSCEAKEPTREGVDVRRAGVSCKRNATAAHDGASDDEDDRIPLSRLMKKRRGAKPVPNGEPNRGRERICQSGESGGLSKAMPTLPPIDCAAGSSHRKNSSKADGLEDGAKIGGRHGSAVCPPFQVKTPSHSDMARRIVESVRAGAETSNGHTGSPLDATASLVLSTIKEQGKTNGGMQKMKGPLGNGGIVEKACVVARAIREQQETQGQVLKVDVLPGTNGIGQQSGKLSMNQDKEVSSGGRLRPSYKPVSASLQPNNQLTLHSEQVPADSSLPTSLQPNNQLMLLSEQMPVESSLPSAVTKHWKFATDVNISCLENNEICIQAACALLRQNKLTIQGGRTGYTKFSKLDALRVSALVEFLLDGNLQGPLKRTYEELVKHDPGGIDLLKRVSLEFSEQLFSIYRNKEDPYFR